MTGFCCECKHLVYQSDIPFCGKYIAYQYDENGEPIPLCIQLNIPIENKEKNWCFGFEDRSDEE